MIGIRLCGRNSFSDTPHPVHNDSERSIEKRRTTHADWYGAPKRDRQLQTLGHSWVVTWKMHWKNNHKYEVWESSNENSVTKVWGNWKSLIRLKPTRDWQNPRFITDKRKTQVVRRFPHTFVRYSKAEDWLSSVQKSSPQFGSVIEKIGWNSKSYRYLKLIPKIVCLLNI